METKAPLADFLEVNINMEKFNLFASTLSSALAAHDRQLQQHSKELTQLRLTMEDRTTRLKGQLQYEKDRFDKKRNEDNIFYSGVMTDTLKKYDDLMQESKRRLTSLEDKVSQTKGQQEIAKNVKDEVRVVMGEQMRLMEEQMAMMENHIKELQKDLKKSINTQDFLLKNVIEAYQSKSKAKTDSTEIKNEQREMKPSNSPFKSQKVKNHHHHSNTATPPPLPAPDNKQHDKILNIEQVTFKEAQERRKKKAQDKCEQQNLQYASISAKIDQLEHRLTAKENQSLNKVIYASKNGARVASESSQQGIPMSMDRIQLQRKNLESNITEKLEHIEQIIQEKLQGCDKETDRLKNKIDILADQVDIALRKFQRERNKAVDISLQLKKIQEKRIDDKVIDSLVLMIKRNVQNLQEQLEQKVQKDIWEKDSVKLNDKLTILSQGLADKADKDEIRRAFGFVEDKIKEIVMLMANDAQHQKQGAGRRLPFKCLSCDKDLENSLPSTQRNHTSSASRLPTRNGSSNLRKRVRGGGCMQSR